MDVRHQVLGDGDVVAGSGRLVRDELGDWFEPALARRRPGLRGAPPIAPHSPFAVAVTGANLDVIDKPEEREGRISGWASLTGRFADRHLAVLSQDRPTADRRRQHAWTTPPCPPPTGGWPETADGVEPGLEFDLGDLTETGAAVNVVVFRPGERQEVLVVAASDPDRVDAVLRPQLGSRLCITASRYTRSEVARANADLKIHWDDWQLYGFGTSADEQGQTQIDADVTWMTPEFANWEDAQPYGLLLINSWLTRVR